MKSGVIILFKIGDKYFKPYDYFNCENCEAYSVIADTKLTPVKCLKWYLGRGAAVVSDVDLNGGYDVEKDQFRCGKCL